MYIVLLLDMTCIFEHFFLKYFYREIHDALKQTLDNLHITGR